MMLSGVGTRVLLVGTGTYAPDSGLLSFPRCRARWLIWGRR